MPKIIEITFDKEIVGLIDEKIINRLFNNPPKIVGVKEGLCSIVKDPLNNDRKVLQIKYQKEIIQEEKTRWRLRFDKPVESATVTYKVMFPEGFDFVRGGKLPGFYGGTAPRGGDKSNLGDGFTARVMWRENGEIFQYMYWMEKDEKKNWGDDLPWIDLDGDMRPFRFIPGKWHTLTTRIVMNTPGENDGNITCRFDGKLALSTTGTFRAKGMSYGIDSFMFTTFFGGNDATWAPKKDEFVYFGDIKIELE
ncbi:MAG: polysaccharide lyase [Candidatus Paceibacterota bacterium]|jgi:hypothetical protein